MTASLAHWVVASISLLITAYFVPGFKVSGFVSALIASAIIGIVNVFVWPVLTLLTLPLTIVTFGIFLFIVNGIALKIAAALSPGFSIEGFFPAVIGSVVLSIVGALVRFVVFGGHF